MSTDEDESRRGVADAGLGLAAGALGSTAAVALFGTGVSGAIAGGVAPAALVLGTKLYGSAVARRQRRAERTLEIAATCLGGLDILEERVASHDDRVELLARVLEASGRSRLEAKVRALGRVLADGVRDAGPVDEAFALAAALEVIEVAHVVVLKYLADTPLPLEEGLKEPLRKGWETSKIADALPELIPVVDSVVGDLSVRGLVRDAGAVTSLSYVGSAAWQITPLGQRCLFLLHDDEVQHW